MNRRIFMKSSGVAAAAALLAGPVRPGNVQAK